MVKVAVVLPVPPLVILVIPTPAVVVGLKEVHPKANKCPLGAKSIFVTCSGTALEPDNEFNLTALLL